MLSENSTYSEKILYNEKSCEVQKSEQNTQLVLQRENKEGTSLSLSVNLRQYAKFRALMIQI